MTADNKINWQARETNHYVFSFFPDSLAENDIAKIIKEQEKWYALITKIFGIKNRRKISYYLYPSRQLKQKITDNSGNAHANWDDFSVHAIYSSQIKAIGPHEDTHLLTLSWGKSLGLLRDGLAEYLHPLWQGRPHNSWARKFLKTKTSLSSLFDDKIFYKNLDLNYPVAGSFVKYLIDYYGLEKFKRTYRTFSSQKKPKPNIRKLESIYKKIFNEIESGWRKEVEKN